MQRNVKVVVERHADTFVAYPPGITGGVIGEGPTYETALADVHSALEFHLETFGEDALEPESPVLEAFVTDLAIAS